MALSAVGCASVRTGDTAGLPEDLPQSWSSNVEVHDLPITASFLKLVSEEPLKQLVQEALENNANLAATAIVNPG